MVLHMSIEGEVQERAVKGRQVVIFLFHLSCPKLVFHLVPCPQVTPSLAKLLLHMYGWNQMEIVDGYRQDCNRLLTAAHIKPLTPPQSAPSTQQGEGEITCPVCLAPMSLDNASHLSCGHTFCKDCWSKHFEVQITHGISTGKAFYI